MLKRRTKEGHFHEITTDCSLFPRNTMLVRHVACIQHWMGDTVTNDNDDDVAGGVAKPVDVLCERYVRCYSESVRS